MKKASIVIAILILFLVSAKTLAQDPVFTQWEFMPLHVNPALTGDFEGMLNVRSKYRNQWQSLLKGNSYRTNAASVEYNFPKSLPRKVSVGLFAVRDKAGQLNFRTNAYNITTSIVQNLGDPEGSHHLIAIGLKAGMENRKIDLENAMWPGGVPPDDVNSKVNYASVSAGLQWQFITNTRYAFRLGAAMHHVNRPDISFFGTRDEKLYRRFNLHGNMEIPFFHKVSVVPSFLFLSQGPSEQLLFGFSGKWHLNSADGEFVQIGLFAKTSKNNSGSDIDIYVLATALKINSMLFGFSFDRFQSVESNAYEFSVGYTLGRKTISSEN